MPIQMKNIYTLLILMISTISYAQMNADAYRFENSGDKFLANGRYAEAKAAYEKCRIVTNGKSLTDINKKIDSTDKWIKIHERADVIYRRGDFDQSLKEFRKYRQLLPGVSIRAVDEKIENCIRRIEGQERDRDVRKVIAENDKLIFGIEKNYSAEKLLAEARFGEALDMYKAARERVRNVRGGSSIIEVADIRIKQIDRCLGIQRDAEATIDLKRKYDLYRSYSNNGGIIVMPIERTIALLRVQLDRVIPPPSQPQNPEQNLLKIAVKCEINTLNALLGYIAKESTLYTRRDSLYDKLVDLNDDVSKIRNLDKVGDDEQRINFVLAGYEVQIAAAEKIPVVGTNLKVCLSREYHELLIKLARRNLEREKDLSIARERVLKSIKYATTKSETDESNRLLELITARIGCENIIGQVSIMLSTAEENMNNCLLSEAKKNLQKLTETYTGCNSRIINERISDIRQRINTHEGKLRDISGFKVDFDIQIRSFYCEEAERTLSYLDQIEICNKSELITAFINRNRYLIEDCRRKKKYNSYIAEAKTQVSEANRQISPGIDINLSLKKYPSFKPKTEHYTTIETGISGAEEKIRIARAAHSEAKKIADDKNSVEMKRTADEIETTAKTIKSLRKDIKVIKMARYDRLVKPELFFAAIYLRPTISVDGPPIQMQPTIAGNYEAGINLRMMRRGRPLSSILSAHYAVNDFQILNSANELSEQVKTEYLTGECRITSRFDNNTHPYIGFGIGVYYPIRVDYYDAVDRRRVVNKYFSQNDYVRTHMYSGLYLGFEARRKNMGLSFDVFARISGFLEDEKTKEAFVKVFKTENFNFSNGIVGIPMNVQVLTIGVSMTFHLW